MPVDILAMVLLWVIVLSVIVLFLRQAFGSKTIRTVSLPAAPCSHEFVDVTAYARQCRKCAAFRFKANAPPGFREYVDYVRTAPLHPVETRPPWMCHCGAQMAVQANCDRCGGGMVQANVLPGDGRCKETWLCQRCQITEEIPNAGLGPIYVCPQCESWRKVEYV